MQFLFPWMLLGALGVSVPITIHLLNRYRFKIVDWGAMELLRKALIVRARRVKLEDLLLLALRCLIILLVALALARPVLTPQGIPWLAKNNNVSAVIALDASFSMAHAPGTRSRFDRAADRVREIAKTLKPGNPVTLVLFGDRPRFLMRNEGFDAERFEAKLKEAAPLPERLAIESCLDEICEKKFLDEIQAPVVEFYLVTDAQINSWSPLSEKTRQSLDQLGQKGRVFILPVTSSEAENLAITRFEPKSGLVRKGVTVEVEVGNFGKQARDNVAVSLLVNDVPVDQGVVSRIEPDKTETIALFARIDKAGPARLTARLDQDDLALDNVRHAVVEVRDKSRILLVRAHSAEATPDDKDFVLTALAPAPNESLVVDSATWLELATRKLGDYQTIILANVPDLPDELMRTLYYFVKEGGGLIVFLGDNAQPALMNARFQHENVPLLPAEVQEPVSDPKGYQIETVEHPLSHILAGLPSQFVAEARVFRYFKLNLGAGGRETMKIAGGGGPIVAEKALGRGKVVLFASAPEPSWTNMVVEPAFYPILLHEAVTFVGKQPHERQFTVSDSLVLPLPVTLKEESPVKQVTFHSQGGSPTVRDVEIQDGLPFAKLPVAEHPGFYEIRADQPMQPLVAAVNIDPRESRVQTLPLEGLAESVRGLPVRLIADGETLESSIRESRVGRELWKEVLMLLLALLVVEGLLARWFSREKVAAKTDGLAA